MKAVACFFDGVDYNMWTDAQELMKNPVEFIAQLSLVVPQEISENAI